MSIPQRAATFLIFLVTAGSGFSSGQDFGLDWYDLGGSSSGGQLEPTTSLCFCEDVGFIISGGVPGEPWFLLADQVITAGTPLGGGTLWMDSGATPIAVGTYNAAGSSTVTVPGTTIASITFPVDCVPVYFQVMNSTFTSVSNGLRSLTSLERWTDLGSALAGTGGQLPQLLGEGSLCGTGTSQYPVGTRTTLSNALPGATAFHVLGITSLNAPFKLGVLVPFPTFVAPLTVDPSGGIVLSAPWPTGVPSGAQLFIQYWIQDPGGPSGFSASNGIVGTTP